jgi:hypothetical protein
MSQQLWGPALEAELEYRRELAAKAYVGRPASSPWVVRAWRRSRAWVTTKHEQHTTRVADRTRDAVARFGDTHDTIAARTDSTAWQQQDALEALRPREGVGRHAA